MTSISVGGFSIDVQRHAIGKTATGIAGFFEALLPTGQTLFAAGRWDDERCEGDTSWCMEYVWLDGSILVPPDEGSYFFLLRGGVDGVTAEEIALAITAPGRRGPFHGCSGPASTCTGPRHSPTNVGETCQCPCQVVGHFGRDSARRQRSWPQILETSALTVGSVMPTVTRGGTT